MCHVLESAKELLPESARVEKILFDKATRLEEIEETYDCGSEVTGARKKRALPLIAIAAWIARMARLLWKAREAIVRILDAIKCAAIPLTKDCTLLDVSLNAITDKPCENGEIEDCTVTLAFKKKTPPRPGTQGPPNLETVELPGVNIFFCCKIKRRSIISYSATR